MSIRCILQLFDCNTTLRRKMEFIKGSLDDISCPASRELTGGRVSSVSLPLNERIFNSTPFSRVVLTNDVHGVQHLSNGTESRPIINSGVKDPEGVSNCSANNEINKEDLELQSAIEEMNRLDEILFAKALKQQEAKQRRKEHTENLWRELLNIPNGRPECAHEASFLALESPTAEVQGEENDFEPVFETQCDDHDSQRVKQREKRPAGASEPYETDLVETEEELFRGSDCKASKNRKKHKNYVKRNIKLISGEGGQEVLTMAEKKRLDGLLREIDQEEEDSARGADTEEDVWAISVSTGQGYTPEPPDLKHLNDIDSRIRLLLPIEEFSSLQGSFSNFCEIQGCGFEAGWKSDGDPLPGEKVLKDIKEWRGQERRLQEIQLQLEILRHSQDMTEENPELTEEQLGSLLEECELTETWRDMDMTDFTPR